MNTAPATRDWRWLMVVIAAAIIAADRWTKLWIVHHLAPGMQIVIWPHVFNLSHVINTGAAFSMFEDMHSQQMVRLGLIGFSCVAVLVVIALLWKFGRTISITSISLALILGGAIGNLYDRIYYRYVVDFLEVHIVHYHWPDFNLADSAIVVGACLLLLEMLRPQRDSER
jgi:signal peptidase II